MTSEWAAPFSSDVNTDTPTVARADRVLLVIPGDEGIVRGFVDAVDAEQHARITRGVVARIGVVVQDYRDGAA